MELQVFGGLCIKKEIKTVKEEQKLRITVALQGYVDEIDVTTQEKYDSIVVNDKVKVAYIIRGEKVNSTDQKGNKKVDVLPVLNLVGIEKVDKRDKDFESLGKIEVNVLSTSANSMKDSEDPEKEIRWWRANLEGGMSLEHKISEDEYKMLKEFHKYEVTYIPQVENYKKVVKVLNWKDMGENERGFSL